MKFPQNVDGHGLVGNIFWDVLKFCLKKINVGDKMIDQLHTLQIQDNSPNVP